VSVTPARIGEALGPITGHCPPYYCHTAYQGESAMRLRNPFAILLLSLLSAACTPTVQLAMPNEPININLNVKIEHQIYIKVDKELDSLLDPSSGLF
jgi:hypothetical protein